MEIFEMPEGPEVRRNAEELSAVLSGVRIDIIRIASGRYLRKPITDLPSLEGRSILTVHSKGKLIYFGLDDGRFVHSTLGMSGYWSLSPSAHARLVINGGVYFNDTRNFGTLKIVSALEHAAKLSLLGHDFSRDWHVDAAVASTLERLSRWAKKLSTCSALLDQRIFCGIGNYLRAEALYEARLSPLRAVLSLSEAESRRLVQAALEESRLAWELGRNYRFAIYHQRCSPAGNPISSTRCQLGRTIWWCPAEQR